MTQAVLGARTFDKGHVRIIPNVNDTVEVSRFRVDQNKLVAPVATPTVAADAMHKDFVDIVTGDHQFYDEMNPREDFKSDFEFLHPSGPQRETRYAEIVRSAIQSETVKSIQNNIEKLTWLGDTASGNVWLQRTDGLEKIIEAEGTVNNVTPAGNLTPANIIGIMEDLIQAQKDTILEEPNTTFLMNVRDLYKLKEAYRDPAITKGVNFPEAGPPVFGGFPISTVGISENKICLTNTGTGRESNLAAATWMYEDTRGLNIDRLQANSDLWFVKATFKLGVNIMYGDQIAYYKPV
jgi:hypothetical protein